MWSIRRKKMTDEIEGIDVDEYRQYLKIDKDVLDDVISSQADIFFRVSEAYALVCSKRDKAKENLKQDDAKLDMDIREDLFEENIKLTEGKINNLVTCHADHIEAAGVYLDLCEDANVLGSLKDSFSQRSYMIRELVELYTIGYYSEADSVRGKRDMREQASRKRLDEETPTPRKSKRKDR